MEQSEVVFTIEELQSGTIEAAEAIEPMFDLVDLENGETYECTMKPYNYAQRIIFAVEVYMAEVYNGGHEQFFFNSSGVVWKDALVGLKTIGAKEALAILARVVAKLEYQIPDDVEKRRAMMDELEEGLFEEDDDAFYALEMDLAELEKGYIRKNAEAFVPQTSSPETTVAITSNTNHLLYELQYYFKKCSDCGLHPEYKRCLEALLDQPLTQELVDYLCEKATSTKHWPELRFAHLRILLLNQSSRNFDLKQWYFDGWKRSRRLWLRLFCIRGYAIYATESELEPVMKRFGELLQKNHDYTDYTYILSSGGLLYLANQYDYPCFAKALEIARTEYEKIDPLLRDMWTLNERLETVEQVSAMEAHVRVKTFLAKNRDETGAKAAHSSSGEADGIHRDVIQLQPGRKYRITLECKIIQQAFPTVPTLSLPAGTEGSIMLDVDRYTGVPGLSARKSTKLSVRMNPKAPGYFLVESNAGELHISFQGWIPSAEGTGIWQESTAFPTLAMTRKELASNKILYGCNAALETDSFNCFVFTVEWKEVQP